MHGRQVVDCHKDPHRVPKGRRCLAGPWELGKTVSFHWVACPDLTLTFVCAHSIGPLTRAFAGLKPDPAPPLILSLRILQPHS